MAQRTQKTNGIAAKSVTLAKIQDVAANSMLGNNTGAPTTSIELTAAQIKSFLSLASAAYTPATDYATSAQGVTNGNTHDHVGGDGARSLANTARNSDGAGSIARNSDEIPHRPK
jgi:hypothetical protein